VGGRVVHLLGCMCCSWHIVCYFVLANLVAWRVEHEMMRGHIKG